MRILNGRTWDDGFPLRVERRWIERAERTNMTWPSSWQMGCRLLQPRLHAPTVLASLVPGLRAARYRIAPITLVRFGRVAVMDEIGSAFNSRVALILIGERPGLGSADSLGAYLVFALSSQKTDADRNCVSNIRPGGLQPKHAAETVFYLIQQILQRQLSGVAVKDERVSRPRLT